MGYVALSEPENGSWPPARRALRLGEDMEDGARSTIFDLLSPIFHLPSSAALAADGFIGGSPQGRQSDRMESAPRKHSRNLPVEHRTKRSRCLDFATQNDVEPTVNNRHFA